MLPAVSGRNPCTLSCSVPFAVQPSVISNHLLLFTVYQGCVKPTACYAPNFPILPFPSSSPPLPSPPTSSLDLGRQTSPLPQFVLVRLCNSSELPNAGRVLLGSARSHGSIQQREIFALADSLSTNEDLAPPPCRRRRASGNQLYVSCIRPLFPPFVDLTPLTSHFSIQSLAFPNSLSSPLTMRTSHRTASASITSLFLTQHQHW